ncbi:hypothetical protein [Lacticaseibacillus sharpeae]|nr:hypothetical protein [Lacticaseibacillus sharpeae]
MMDRREEGRLYQQKVAKMTAAEKDQEMLRDLNAMLAELGEPPVKDVATMKRKLSEPIPVPEPLPKPKKMTFWQKLRYVLE